MVLLHRGSFDIHVRAISYEARIKESHAERMDARHECYNQRYSQITNTLCKNSQGHINEQQLVRAQVKLGSMELEIFSNE